MPPTNPNSRGRQALRKRLAGLSEDLQALGRGEVPSTTNPWLTGGGPTDDRNKALREEIERNNESILYSMGEQDVTTLPDLWPDKSNYYQGPSKSTRVSKHMFSLNPSSSPYVPPTHGTMYVKFTNMRPNGTIRRENIYAYYDVPHSVYVSFTASTSKGQEINRLDKIYNYARLDDESVFDIGA